MNGHEAVIANLERVGDLTELLLARKAVPAVRLNYSIDPETHVGGRGKSRKAVSEKSGAKGSAILRSPHFVKYLKYFLHGPDLPLPSVQGFCKILDDDAGPSGDVQSQIMASVRKDVRSKGLDKRHAADEFFKLAHEAERPDLAENVRSAAMQVK